MTLQPYLSASQFVGRDRELADIAELLLNPACHLLTLVGPGGIGKTRLAIEASHHASFPNGIYLVPLQPLTSPDFMVSAIADAIGFQFYSGADPRQQLIDYFREKSLLLVLDNVEHLLEGVTLLSEILAAAPEVRVLATSRERLNLREEWVLEVGALNYPASERETDIESYSAVELFVQHARRSNVNFTLTDDHKPAIIRICHLVGGMPLGIELAAAWVRALSCEAIADEISHSLDILETPARNVEPRHRTMRAAFEPTWNRLSEAERSVFMKLSVFRGGFTREAAEYVAGASLRTLTALVDKSLIRVDGNGRYDLHELLRQFAEGQLKASGEREATRDAQSAYYAAFLQQKWQPLRTERQAVTLDEIEAEFDNVCVAWHTMVEKRKTAELSMAVYPLWYYSDLRGRYHEALALFKQAEDALRPAADDPETERVIGQILKGRGWFYVILGKLDEGRVLADEALAILLRVGSLEDVALAFDSLCSIEAFAGDAQALKRNAEQMAQIARHINDRWLLAGAHFPLANAALFADDLEEARRVAQEGLNLAEACGDLWVRAFLRAVCGSVAQKLGEHAEAKQCFEQTLKLLEEIGQDCTIGALHRELGLTALHMNDYPLAAYHYQQGLKIIADTGGYTYYIIAALVCIAELSAAQGDKTGAVELLTLAFHHPESYPNEREKAEQKLLQLQIEFAPDTFAAAQERGKQLELRTVVPELITELGKLAQVAAQTSAQSLAYPLTARELEIMHLVADGLSNREIADRLFLAVGTVKWYINEIFGKLHVANRTQAVARARMLGVLS